MPEPTVVNTPQEHAAVLMNQALTAHGYKQADQGLYRSFQSLMSLSPVDGFPGTGTMHALAEVLASMAPPVPLAPVKIYPWRSMPGTSGYDGINAPTWAEWTGGAVVSPVDLNAPPSPDLAAATLSAVHGPHSVPWPTAVPATLPPFPSAGWVPEAASPEVQARALYWNPKLWNLARGRVARPFVTEQFGGRWLTFAPTVPQPGVMAVSVYRLAPPIPA
jgi:hypothetical protein